MHIVIDALLVHGAFSGVQHAILHQLRGMLALPHDHRVTVLVPQEVDLAASLGATPRPYEVVHAPFAGDRRLTRIWWEQAHLPRLLKELDADLLYAPGYLTSLGWHGPSVVFIHDTIALSHPGLCTWSNALNYRLLLPPSARHATLVAVPSTCSKEDVVRHCRVPSDRVRVVPLGVVTPPQPSTADIARARTAFGLTDPYLLAVSTIEPKKNFARLIHWFDTWKDAGLPHHLVIIGKWGWGYTDVTRALAASRHRASIHLPGYFPQDALPPIMAGADLLLVPSIYEGFGLPALEGMAVGVPVVVSTGGALPETVGSAGLVLPLEDVIWQAEIPTLLQFPDRLAVMRTNGATRAATHTWQRTAELLLHVLEEAFTLAVR